MTARSGRPRWAGLALAFLALPLLAPSLPADQGPDDFRPIAELRGAQAALRLYGCTDALAAITPPALASGHLTESPAPDRPDGRPDGRLDCPGDRVHLQHAFLQSAANPFYRKALGPRDQIVAAELGYLPTAWYPGPSHPSGIADPVDPAKGLFDRDDDGHLDPAPPPGGPYDDQGVLRPVDHRAPRDNLPDIAPRGDDGAGHDRYFPALTATYRHVWTAGTNRPVPLPAGASFVLPISGAQDPPGLDGWTTAGRETATHWHPTPFGVGSDQDGIGAFHTEALALAAGDEAWFLGHGVRVSEFFGAADSPRIAIELLFDGPDGIEVLASSVILTPDADDPDRYATVGRAAGSPSNLVFADRAGIDRNVPRFDDPTDPARDAAAFVLAESVRFGTGGGADRVSLRLGRVVAEQAPWNAFVVDEVLYHIPTLNETAGELHAFALTALHPLGEPVDIRSAGLRLSGLTSREPLYFLPPFDRDHVVLDDLDPRLARDAGGFLQAADGGPTIRTDGLALRNDARTPAERARPVGPLVAQWRTTGLEERFAVPMVALEGDAALTFSALLPSRYVEVVLPDGRYRVDSVLLDDGASLSGANDAPASPRGFRSFVFDPRDPTPLFLGEAGLRLFSGTAAHPDAGDTIRFDPVLLRRDDHAGRIQTPTALADEVVRLSVSYEAMAHLPGQGRPEARGDGSLVDGSDGIHDHLWDLADESAVPVAMLETRYDFSFVDHGTLEALAPPLGARTTLMLPAAERNWAHSGLDSFDIDGDGTPDEVGLVGYWDMDRSGTARERLITGGLYRVDGNASTADLLWLRSGPLTLSAGQEARFFDHGVRLDATRAVDGTAVPRLDLLDLRPLLPLAAGTVSDADASQRDCVPVHWDATVGAAVSCAELRLASPVAGTPPTDTDTKWWVEIEAVSDSAVTVVLNRVVTHIDRAVAGDERLMFVGGGLYRWERPHFQDASLRSLSLTQLLPLERPVEAVLAGGDTLRVEPMPAGGRIPLLPPFGETHQRLQLGDVAVERSEEGFLDARGDPSDLDAVLASRDRRVDTMAGLALHYGMEARETRHHFVMFDPTRTWDPARRGTAFVNGVFALPTAEAPARPGTPAALRTVDADGFDEALQGTSDRGWDHFVHIQIEGTDRVVVDSARLATPVLTARVADQAPGATAAPHPNDPALWASSTRGSGLWLWRMHEPADLYVVPLEAEPDASPSPTPVTLPDTPSATNDWPTDSVDPRANEGSAPGLLVLLALACVALATVHGARRR